MTRSSNAPFLLLSLLMAAAALVVAVLLLSPKSDELLPQRLDAGSAPIDQASKEPLRPAGGDKGQETHGTGGPGAVETGPGTGKGPVSSGPASPGEPAYGSLHLTLSAAGGAILDQGDAALLPVGRRAPEIALVSRAGAWVGDEVAPGEYGIRYRGPEGYPEVMGTKFLVKPGTRTSETMVLPIRRASIELVDSRDGTAITSGRIFASGGHGAPAWSGPRRTSPGGIADLWLPARTTSQLLVEADGYAWAQETLNGDDTGATTVRIPMERSPGVRLVVRAAWGQGPAEVRISFVAGDRAVQFPRALVLDGSGGAHLLLPRDASKLRIDADGFAEAGALLTEGDFTAGQIVVEMAPLR